MTSPRQFPPPWTVEEQERVVRVSTPQQKCIGWPEQKYINDAGEQGPELGAFVRHQTWAGLSAGVSELARRERLLL